MLAVVYLLWGGCQGIHCTMYMECHLLRRKHTPRAERLRGWQFVNVGGLRVLREETLGCTCLPWACFAWGLFALEILLPRQPLDNPGLEGHRYVSKFGTVFRED